MKITAISDFHGQLPPHSDLPPADVLVIAGDVCPDIPSKEGKYSFPDTGGALQGVWLDTHLRPWLEGCRWWFDHIIAIAGNHDFVFEHKGLVPDLPWTYLEDSGVEIDGVRFWGTPWVPGLPRWAFHGTANTLAVRARAIPENTDVLISHGPPYQILDAVACGWNPATLDTLWEHVGESEIRARIEEIKPQATICGHIHDMHGWNLDLGSPVYNVSLLDDYYMMVYPPTEIKVDDPNDAE